MSEIERKFDKQKHNAKQRGLDHSLTVEDIQQMLDDAGITVDQWGQKGGFALARYGDQGGYTKGNCRFVTYRENTLERNEHYSPSEEIRQKISDSKKGKTHSEEIRKKISDSQKGEKNSQYGTMWITNGSINKKIKRTEPIPSGFWRGRKTQDTKQQ